ncbi:MAG TPA: hypothetical protein PKK06_00625 [Phycisphaerae bacterium]|nr:hypothetical protein [Phycisphaerae bacterium]HNU43887.1 hypothetical protein [Phycisphaerae bacterium]
MTNAYEPIDPRRIRTYSIRQRQHKAALRQAARLPEPGASAAELIDSLPDVLGAAALRSVVAAMVQAVRANRPIVAALGAHVVKVGCGPVIVDLIRRGIVRAVACNGATAIHDVEIATLGETSEDVAPTIRDGTFGMVRETMDFFDEAVSWARQVQVGLGTAVGRLLLTQRVPHAEASILATAADVGIPATVHVALGTDTVHMSAGADGAAWGAASMHDFRLLCAVVGDLGAATAGGAGGVWLNIGSAVILPEVFLKAVSVARNLGADLDALVTANFDMIRHYRPHANVVTRPVAAGHGHEVVGQHEILLPLLRQAVLERLAAAG